MWNFFLEKDVVFDRTINLENDFQVTVWGDYGRLEGRKVFMGVAQIMLDKLNLNEMVFGWYKLYGTASLVSLPPSLGVSRRSSAASLESLKLLNYDN